jgi:hypothetical protein
MPSVVSAWLPSRSLHSMARPSACPDKQEARATAARGLGPRMGMSGGHGTMRTPGAGHVPRPGPGLGPIRKCPWPGSKSGHVPGGRASIMGMSGGPGNRGSCPAANERCGTGHWTCPAPEARTGPNPQMSTARLEEWACPPEGGLQKWACPPGAQRKVAAPEETATFKLQTAWPQGADSLRITGN